MTRLVSAATVTVLVVLLAGCSMSNDEVIRETKKCEAAGMQIEAAPALGPGIMAIHCVPKELKW